MKVVRLLGYVLMLLLLAGMIVWHYGYGEITIPFFLVIPAIFLGVFLFFYFASLIITDSFTELPKTIFRFFVKY